MEKTTIEVFGMMCGMCESHINNAIRKAFEVRKVSASRRKNQVTMISETPIDHEKLKTVVAQTGYDSGKITSEPYRKKGLFG